MTGSPKPAPAGSFPAVTDHLVYAVPDLAAGVGEVEERLGVPLTPGGSHPGLGTRNALLKVGPRVYLEVVGPDPEQPPPPGGLWLARGAAPLPALVTWAVRSGDLHGLADGAAGHLLGPVRSMSRATPGGQRISWMLSMPREPLPRRGIVPFFIDWGATPHPCASLPDHGVTLAGLDARHPDPDAVRTDLKGLGVALAVAHGTPELRAFLRTPARGEVRL